MSTAAERRAKTLWAAAVQRQAIDPGASVWVAASAGTGKTKVLTDRVASLLLHGTAPSRVLCLTFTKAAAAEMSNRLAERLASWTILGGGELAARLEDLLGTAPEPEMLDRARSLFALVLDTPGGIRIQTIHAFCQSLLGRFPLEAGIAPQAQVLDERAALDLLENARREVLGGLADQGGTLGRALSTMSAMTYEEGFGDLLDELLRERSRLDRMVRHHGGLEPAISAIYRALDCREEESILAIKRRAAENSSLDRTGLQAAANAMVQGTATDQTHGAVVAAWLEAETDVRVKTLDGYLGAFFTDGGAGSRRAKLIHKEAQNLAPGAAATLAVEAERLDAVRRHLNSLTVAEATAALLRLGHAILEVYATQKRQRGLLDYDDLILEARDLLRQAGAAAWVLFKLDGGLDHILIDEAQDTNPEQWEVIETLSAEFFAGAGAREAVRTVFAVGDAKQSIYSFQRADPRAFTEMRQHFADRAREAEQGWEQIALQASFRSTAAVLRAVDAVFTEKGAGLGAFIDLGGAGHDPVRVGQGGLVEVWPPVGQDQGFELDPWDPPDERESLSPAHVRLARLIAWRIRAWTLDPENAQAAHCQLDSKGRRLRPGDFLILVRRRNAFFDALVREFKEQGVPVAGVDRMVLTEQMAVMDLIALGHSLLLPEDDLNLATVLKGPLIGLDEEQLFALAYDREGSLWEALHRRAGEDLFFEAALAKLRTLRAKADFQRPYEFFAELLGPDGGREALLANLGPEARDPIEEFLSQALAYERSQTPTLQGFLHWLEASDQAVNRDMELGGDAVRVMTVHGAKGLQAPVVILPDTLQPPPPHRGLLWSKAEGGTLIWPVRRALDGSLAEEARALVATGLAEEYRRLLYVAMTRAEDRLYVCGWNRKGEAPEQSWYHLIHRALEGAAETLHYDFTAEIADGWGGPGLRLRHVQAAEPEEQSEALPPEAAVAKTPDWIAESAPAEPSPPRPLAPSRPRESEPAALSPLGRDQGRRFRRGIIVHRLLESLPELAPERREEAAKRFLDQGPYDLSPEEAAEILSETLAVLAHSEFAPLFGPDSQAEVALTGLIEGPDEPEAVSGQVDRLVVTEDRVMIVDYKTNRPAPLAADDVPRIYLKQMALYSQILSGIYPDKEVSAYLLWTDGPRIMQLSNDRLAGQVP